MPDDPVDAFVKKHLGGTATAEPDNPVDAFVAKHSGAQPETFTPPAEAPRPVPTKRDILRRFGKDASDEDALSTARAKADIDDQRKAPSLRNRQIGRNEVEREKDAFAESRFSEMFPWARNDDDRRRLMDAIDVHEAKADVDRVLGNNRDDREGALGARSSKELNLTPEQARRYLADAKVGRESKWYEKLHAAVSEPFRKAFQNLPDGMGEDIAAGPLKATSPTGSADSRLADERIARAQGELQESAGGRAAMMFGGLLPVGMMGAAGGLPAIAAGTALTTEGTAGERIGEAAKTTAFLGAAGVGGRAVRGMMGPGGGTIAQAGKEFVAHGVGGGATAKVFGSEHPLEEGLAFGAMAGGSRALGARNPLTGRKGEPSAPKPEAVRAEAQRLLTDPVEQRKVAESVIARGEEPTPQAIAQEAKVMAEARIEVEARPVEQAEVKAEAERILSEPAEAKAVQEAVVAKGVEPTPKALAAEASTQAVTSIKNRIVNKERVERGLGEMEAPLKQSFGEWADKAIAEMGENPNRGYELTAELAANPRPHTPVEAAILTIHRVNLRKQRAAADEAGVKAAESGDVGAEAAAAAKVRADILEVQLAEAEKASGGAGTEAGRALGARRMEMAQDYSLAAMERAVRRDQGYKPLSEAQRAETKALHERIAKTEAERDALLARAEAAEAKQNVATVVKASRSRKAPPISSPEYGKANKIVTREVADAALVRIREKLSRLSVNIDPTLLVDLGIRGAYHVEAGAHTFAVWAKAMTEELGEKVTPHLRAAWDAAQKQVTGKTVGDVAAKVKAGIESGKSIVAMPGEINKLAEMFVRQGVKDYDDLVAKVHEVLVGIDPSVTKRQTMDAVSGYGRVQALNMDPVKVELRELKGQMQQIAKLEDMASGKAPLKSGPQRQTPQDAQRELIRLVGEAKKKGGYDVRDPAAELKSALDSTKTRLKNEIADMERQIAAKAKDVKSGRSLTLDAEATTLKAKRDALKEQYDELFVKPGLTDAQRVELAIKATERSITEYERRVKAGDVFPGKSAKGPSDPKLDALRARREALRAEVADMRGAATPRRSTVEAEIKALEKSIAEYQRKVQAGDVFGKKVEPSEPVDPRIAALRAQRDALREQAADMREAATPRLSDHAVALKALKTRLLSRTKELQRQVEARDFATPERKPLHRDPEAIRIEAEHETAVRAFHEARFREKRKRMTAWQKAGEIPAETFNFSRAIMTSMDLSAVGRQGWVLGSSHPVLAGKAIPTMLKAFRSAEHQARSEAEMRLDPMYAEAKRAKLSLTELGNVPLARMEEAMAGHWVDKIPTALGGGLLRGSQRAHTAYLNRLRFDVFKTMMKNLPAGEATPKQAEVIANYVNVASGRGTIDDGKLAQALAAMNSVFFAPRLVMSRFQLLGGRPFKGTDAATRKLIAKEYARFLGVTGLVLFMGGMAGAEISFDQNSADFLKLKMGNTRLDPWAGLQQATVLLARGTGAAVSAVKGEKQERNFWIDLSRFARSKLAPGPGAAIDALAGRDMANQETTPGGEVADLVTPMSVPDIIQAMDEQGIPKGAALGLLSLFGMSLRTYEAKNDRSRNVHSK